MPLSVTHSPRSPSDGNDPRDGRDWKQLVQRVPTGLYIDGSWRESADASTIAVENPATGEILAQISSATEEDGTAALDAAEAASSDWARTPARERGELLRRAFDLLGERADYFATLITLEMGKPLGQARGEVTYGAEFFRWYSEESVRIDGRWAVSPDGRTRLLTMRQPVGPTLMITPWNFPLAMGTRKIGPAIAAGCTMVIKPHRRHP
jgi:succinate-semialdehyde dehydrogenase/glutarate-semialdehyde dehydrogenase